ncbi:hypothetical protein KFU94_40595 [Chloroflexi bacterium TSY]|nr:hypothetical protein [Chloroflexi bacterium TSY]
MDTLFDKISMFVSAKLNELIGQIPNPTRNANNRPADFHQRLRKGVVDLLQTEREIAKLDEQLKDARSQLNTYEQRIKKMDQTIDELLLVGDDARAAAGQQAFNEHRRRLNQFRIKYRHLMVARERSLAEKDRLEVKLSLMGLERQTLDQYLREFQQQQGGQGSTQTWRVVEP